MKVALAQMEVVSGMPNKNLETMLKMIEDAKLAGVDLIAFPEMCVGGYLVGDKWTSDEFCFDLMRKNKKIIEASHGIAIAYGNIFIDSELNKRVGDTNHHPNKDGKSRKYNAVYVIQDGKFALRSNETNILPSGIQPKTLLPTYRIFDDSRYFFSLENIASDFDVSYETLSQPFLIKTRNGETVKVGFELCEDLWCEDYRKAGNPFNPTKILIDNGAQLIVNLSASPWTYGKNSSRDKRVQFLKQESGNSFVPFLYVNCTGVQNNGKNFITFDGGTTAYNEQGIPVSFASAPYRQELMIVESDNLGKTRTRKEKSKIAQKYDAIIRGLESVYGNKIIIGLSGGVDSSLAAGLSVIAKGKENVIGVNMPSSINSQKTKDSAEYSANKYGIEYLVIPIQEMVDLKVRTLEECTGKKITTLELENLQAKIRTGILSDLAGMYNGVYTCNANKLEAIIGYGTLDGDMRGRICPIADLTKTEVIAMAKYLNKEIFHDEVIPKILFPDRLWRFSDDQIKPTAELKEKQFDPMKFGYHDGIVEAYMDYNKASCANIMEMYLSGTLDSKLDRYFEGLVNNPKGLTYELMKRWDVISPAEFVKDIEEFDKKFSNSVFKRVESGPIIITSKTSFGYDFRESMMPYQQTERELELKSQILTMTQYKPASTMN